MPKQAPYLQKRKAIQSIEETLKKMGFEIYMVYGRSELDEPIAFHLELESLSQERIAKLVRILALANTGPMSEKSRSWILCPHDYGGMDIYLSLQPYLNIALKELKVFASFMEKFELFDNV